MVPLTNPYAATNSQQIALTLITHFSVPLRKPVPIPAVAKTLLFLASEAWSGHITGQIINVDGGKNGRVLWPERVVRGE
jgi:enoyl-[acyl-carrier-protein] reductase (NADH)